METIKKNWRYFAIIGAIIFLLIIVILGFSKLFKNDNTRAILDKKLIDLQEKEIENRIDHSVKIDSINEKLLQIETSILQKKESQIIQKTITNKYYQNENKISNYDLNSFTDDSLNAIIECAKFEPFEIKKNRISKNNSSK